MARNRHLFLALLLAALLACASFIQVHSEDADDLEDLDAEDEPQHKAAAHDLAEEGPEEEDYGSWEDEQYPAVDDKDVVVLGSGNFSDFIKKNKFVMVEFYAPWCGHCQQLAPEYADAATKLKGEVALAKVDATVEHDLSQEHEVQGFPTIFFFVDGVKRSYSGHRTGDEIIKWIKKRTGPAVTNVDSVSDAETILAAGSPIAVAFLSSLEGAEAEEFAAAARQDDNVLFYQTTKAEVAERFELKRKKSPAVVLLKKEHETTSHFDGKFEKDAISQFVSTNKLPLVIVFSGENSSLIFDNPIKKQLLLFAGGEDFKSLYPSYQSAAKALQGKLIFVHVDTAGEDAAQITEYFGITAEKPKVMGFSPDEQRKFMLDKDITTDNLKAFGEDFLADKLQQFYKSEPVPEKNDGDVKIVVGSNFDEIVLDESKDVLLEIYAPWCGHCQALEPIYNKLAARLREVKSLVIAKMDGTANEHHRAKSDGFPTLLFFPANKKSFDPITVDADRSVKAFYQFLKKNAAIPFTLPKSEKTKSQAPEEAAAPPKKEELKDEL
ncbi:protein disulfide isomerase-like 1-4 [Selaginella moellendorffii]|uniref:protein disulfide isomerase-like 1-4 n=1 Tax=Selaginella moellendorffii TaxID=88036 RepID=UPI000D1C3E4D|nr:protein disulfide isomerase-like 1-4 [Selaginella moellendorffii]|eukprot:XP_024544402.1 protein disulfide isomerase-like 1-4 [Selaginella moellendorffii]